MIYAKFLALFFSPDIALVIPDADITIVDNLTRSTRMLAIQYKLLSGRSKPALKKILDGFDNNACLASGITRAMSGLKKRARNFA